MKTLLLTLTLLFCAPVYGDTNSEAFRDYKDRLRERRYTAYRSRYQVIYGHRNHRYNFQFFNHPNTYGPPPFVRNPRVYVIPRVRETYIHPIPRL